MLASDSKTNNGSTHQGKDQGNSRDEWSRLVNQTQFGVAKSEPCSRNLFVTLEGMLARRIPIGLKII